MLARHRWTIIALIFLVACTNGKDRENSMGSEAQQQVPADSPRAVPSAEEESVYEAIEFPEAGAVQGLIRLSGPAPVPHPIPVNKDRSICGSAASAPSLRLGPGGEVADAVVSIVGISKGARLQPLDGSARLELSQCAVLPRLQLVPLGTTLEIVNRDPLLHELHAILEGGETLFRVVLPIQDFQAQRSLDRQGTVTLTCLAGHPWMKGYLVVHAHPYHALTDASGGYLLEQIPAGSYRLKAWHELLGESEVNVTIEDGSTVRADFALEARPVGSR